MIRGDIRMRALEDMESIVYKCLIELVTIVLHLLFQLLNHRNFNVKCAWLRSILYWMTS